MQEDKYHKLLIALLYYKPARWPYHLELDLETHGPLLEAGSAGHECSAHAANAAQCVWSLHAHNGTTDQPPYWGLHTVEQLLDVWSAKTVFVQLFFLTLIWLHHHMPVNKQLILLFLGNLYVTSAKGKTYWHTWHWMTTAHLHSIAKNKWTKHTFSGQVGLKNTTNGW